MRLGKFVAAALIAAGVVPAVAEAADQGKSAGNFMVRVRGIGVIPDESGTPSVIGGSVSVESAAVPEVDFSYFITDNIAVELIAATTKHDVSAKGTSLGNVDLGSVWLLPPTLTVQYHFMPKSAFSPYVGAGVNYTFFYNEKSGAVNNISYDNNFGWALQAGFDYKLADNWYFNADVKKIFLSTKAKVNGGAITADVDLDPWVVGVGVGYKF